ncbi:MAG: RNA-binding S4 domain-containing protein [Prevotellaceae bacterium]|nr:RNA-binding S4 domain-containing protein [Prevotellaceae bacterium]
MSIENDNWRELSSSEEDSGNRFERENNYSRPSYNREGGERPYRPRFNPGTDNAGERPQRPYNNYERPQRPRFNPNNDGGGHSPYDNYDRPQRPRFNPNNGGGGRPSYNNNGGGGYDRPQRPRFNPNNSDQRSYYEQQRPAYNDRPQRPRFNQNEGGSPYDRPHRPYNNGGGGQRQPYGGAPQRPRFNPNGGGGRPGGYGRPQPHRGAPNYNPNAKPIKKKQVIEYSEQYVDPNEPIRLNKFLANAGVCSRREADEFITAGVVLVNGVPVTELGTKIKRGDEVKFHEQPVKIERKIYIILNKPKDCVTTADDPKARRTVMTLTKGACEERIYPVGRLDRNTTGVLLLTNDGDLASKLTHPQYLKKKVYQVTLDKNVTRADMEKIATGITLDDGEIRADDISYVDEHKNNVIGIEIHSGKNRIVRRIFEALGYKVTKLDRVLFAGLTKKGLRRGEWRFLNEQEVNFLRMGSFE